MRSTWHGIRSLFLFGVLALVLVGGAGLVWGALVVGNVKTTPSIPWALPALVVFLWQLWRYLGGAGWPAQTSRRRKVLLRANPVSVRALGWSVVAGLLAIAALAGAWIVTFQLVPMPANPLVPSTFTSSPLWAAVLTLGASLLAPIVEESAIRGYLQTALERDFAPATAVVLSSLVFALIHVTQGPAWPKLLLYYLVGLAFGALARLNDSILPGIPVHVTADLTFFMLVWPHDAGRTLVRPSGPDAWFWAHVVQAVVFGALSVLAMRKLSRLRPPATPTPGFLPSKWRVDDRSFRVD